MVHCRAFSANAAYFQIALLAATVFVATKHLALPESWRSLMIKAVRFKLIRPAGITFHTIFWVRKRSRYGRENLVESVSFRCTLMCWG